MSIYQEYLNTREAIEKLQVLLKANEEQCIAELKESKQKSAKTELGTFSLVERKSYKYTDTIVNYEKEISDKIKNKKQLIDDEFKGVIDSIDRNKKDEIEKGEAEVKVAESFRFTAPKK